MYRLKCGLLDLSHHDHRPLEFSESVILRLSMAANGGIKAQLLIANRAEWLYKPQSGRNGFITPTVEPARLRKKSSEIPASSASACS